MSAVLLYSILFKPIFSLIFSIPSELLSWFYYFSLWFLFGFSISKIFLLFPFWLICFWIHSIFSSISTMIPQPLRRCRSRDSTNLVAMPRNRAILSHYQLLMRFAHLIGFLDPFWILQHFLKNFLSKFVLFCSPPYTFFLHQLKELPKGLIRNILDIIFILGHFYVFFYYAYLITAYLFKSLMKITYLLFFHTVRLPLYCLHLLLIISTFFYEMTYYFYSGTISTFLFDKPASRKYTIFHKDGITINSTSSTYKKLSTYAFAAKSARASGTDAVPFDVDSFDIAMDNCASRTMTFCRDDFISDLRPAGVSTVLGTGGSSSILGMGDVEYLVTDYDGIQHSLLIKDALYVTSVPFRLLAVNQLSKQIENVPGSEGTGIFSFG